MLYALLAYYLFGTALRKNYRAFSPKMRIFICLLPAFIITAFRDISVGNDTYVYARAYNLLNTNQELFTFLSNSRFEIGYNLVEFFFKKLGADYYVMQFAITLFIYYSLGRYILKYSMNPWLSCFVFLTTRDFFGPMNTTRMWLAISVILFSLDFLVNRQFVRFILLTALASLFHFTALVFVVMYFFYQVEIDYRIISITTVLSLAVLIMGRSFFLWLTSRINRYSGYLDSAYFNVRDNIAIYIELLLNIAYFTLLYAINKKMSARGITTTGIDKLTYSASLIAVAMSIIGLTNAITSRVAAFFTVFLIISLPNALRRVKKENKVILIPAFILLMIVQFVVVIVFRPHWSGIIPYNFLWNK